MIEYEDLQEVVLVGHSYAGVVITAVAEVVAEKLSHLVYLDAWLPQVGQAMFDLMPPERAEDLREAAKVHGEGIGIPPNPIEVFGITDEEDARWFASKLVLHPLKTFEDPVRLSSEAAKRLPHTYIVCTDNPALAHVFRPFAERARTEEGWGYPGAAYRTRRDDHDASRVEQSAGRAYVAAAEEDLLCRQSRTWHWLGVSWRPK